MTTFKRNGTIYFHAPKTAGTTITRYLNYDLDLPKRNDREMENYKGELKLKHTTELSPEWDYQAHSEDNPKHISVSFYKSKWDDFSECYTLGSVRHPYDWLYSFWKYHKKLNGGMHNLTNDGSVDTFSEWIYWVCDNIDYTRYHSDGSFWFTQYQFYSSDGTIDGEMEIDDFIKLPHCIEHSTWGTNCNLSKCENYDELRKLLSDVSHKIFGETKNYDEPNSYPEIRSNGSPGEPLEKMYNRKLYKLVNKAFKKDFEYFKFKMRRD